MSFVHPVNDGGCMGYLGCPKDAEHSVGVDGTRSLCGKIVRRRFAAPQLAQKLYIAGSTVIIVLKQFVVDVEHFGRCHECLVFL